MRTTLTIDDDVLETAREIALARRTTAGAVISELARRSLAAPVPVRETTVRNGFPVLPKRGGVVTDEMVDALREDEHA